MKLYYLVFIVLCSQNVLAQYDDESNDVANQQVNKQPSTANSQFNQPTTNAQFQWPRQMFMNQPQSQQPQPFFGLPNPNYGGFGYSGLPTYGNPYQMYGPQPPFNPFRPPGYGIQSLGQIESQPKTVPAGTTARPFTAFSEAPQGRVVMVTVPQTTSPSFEVTPPPVKTSTSQSSTTKPNASTVQPKLNARPPSYTAPNALLGKQPMASSVYGAPMPTAQKPGIKPPSSFSTDVSNDSDNDTWEALEASLDDRRKHRHRHRF